MISWLAAQVEDWLLIALVPTATALDAIKLDRSFVSGLGRHGRHDAVVAHTVELGHELGFTVIAEGVETVTEMDVVRY